MGDKKDRDHARDKDSKKGKRRSRSRSRDEDRNKRRKERSRSRSEERSDRKRDSERRKDRSRSRDRSRDRKREKDREKDMDRERKSQERSRDKKHRNRRKSLSKSPESKKRKASSEKPNESTSSNPAFTSGLTSTESSFSPSNKADEGKKSAAAVSEKSKSSFRGLALMDKKKDRSKAQDKSRKEDKAMLEEKEKERRQERLRLWREQQKAKKKGNLETQNDGAVETDQAKSGGGFMVDEDEVKNVQLWSMDEQEDKNESKDPPTENEGSESDIDPLDAFMAELNQECAKVEQQNLAMPKAKVISFEEITSKKPELDIYGSFLPPSNNKLSTAAIEEPMLPKETEAEREAREKAELEEFMRAIKRKREREEKVNNESFMHMVDAHDDETTTTANVDSAPSKKSDTGRIYQGVEEDAIGEEFDHVDNRTALEILAEQQKKKDIKPVDHSQIDYISFRKKFYIEPQDITNMTDEEVTQVLARLEIKIRGKNCPRPIQKWTQTGFSQRLQKLIARQEYVAPFAIQCQALPAIMSGRDVIGIAKTGSGKTLAFLLPMFRHILDQPPLADAEGPIGLIMAPARELVQQIYLESKKFTKDLGLRSTAIYGGSSVSEQIANLKRGSDIVICTPGRMIDILCMSAGKMVSLKRVTYVVLDEADRMFDMGFEPQITKILMNIRTDRQTLLFSATFPRSVESLARKILKKPVEITVGARSTASGDITQYAEVREEHEKFMRLLQLLGIWYEKGNVLVFVNTQQACDQLFQELMKAGYPALSLHGGKDQVDRDYTIDDFKRKVRTLMVATSVAGRGLDVKDLVCVINYHCPNHLEDYVHRVGRTGRAGRKGTAYTFISPGEEDYATDLVKALETAKQEVPPELHALAEGFKEKVRKGEARYHGSGFKGKGFTFDESERNEAQRAADMQRRQYELDNGLIDYDEAMMDDESKEGCSSSDATMMNDNGSGGPPKPAGALTGADKARAILERFKELKNTGLGDASQNNPSNQNVDSKTLFREDLEINDYPQQARWKVVQKDSSDLVADMTGAIVICRGTYIPPGRKPNPGERKLFLLIQGPTRQAVQIAKRELQRILDEKTLELSVQVERKGGKYSI